MAKSANTISKSKKQTTSQSRESDIPKRSPWLEDYTDCLTFKVHPINEATIQRLAEELMHWARTDSKAIEISEWYLNKGISSETFYRWVKKYPNFGAANKVAKTFIGNRRERGGIFKQADPDSKERLMDPTFVYKTMPIYNKKYEKLLDKDALRKGDVASKIGFKAVPVLENLVTESGEVITITHKPKEK